MSIYGQWTHTHARRAQHTIRLNGIWHSFIHHAFTEVIYLWCWANGVRKWLATLLNGPTIQWYMASGHTKLSYLYMNLIPNISHNIYERSLFFEHIQCHYNNKQIKIPINGIWFRSIFGPSLFILMSFTENSLWATIHRVKHQFHL